MADLPEPPEPDGNPPPAGDQRADGWIRPSQHRPPSGSTPPPGRPQPRRGRPDIRAGRTPPEPSSPAGSADDATDFDPIDDLDAAPPTPGGDRTTGRPTEDGEVTAVGAGGTRRAGRAERSRRDRRRALAGASALVLLIAIIAGVALAISGGSTANKHLGFATLTTPTTGPRAPALIATTKGGALSVYDQPNGKVVTTLAAKTDYGLPRTLLATSSQPDWLQVLLPKQPNDTSGWIRGSDVTTATTDYSMRISLGQHHLWLYKAGAPVVDSAVVIGKQETPTPTGLFYVTDPVDLQSQPNGPYGAFALGLSGYSNTLPSFDGGPPQIAVHGTPFADQVGQDISNGCVRVPSPIILQIAKVVPLGTPVTIQA